MDTARTLGGGLNSLVNKIQQGKFVARAKVWKNFTALINQNLMYD